MTRLKVIFAIISLLALSACQTDQPTPEALHSTPLAALPMNTSFQLPTPISDAVIEDADAEYLLLTNVYERSAPSVVNIEVIAAEEDSNILDLGRGSGFVYDTEGHIITNAHVVAAAQSIQITFNNGFVAEAEVVGTDAYSDLAVLNVRVDAERLFPVTLADSNQIRVGQRAIAIGNPFGLASSMTVGIVSGLGRQLPSASLINTQLAAFSNPSIIQVDTDINPGNSGGPLLNSHGEVIGVNTAIRTESGVFQGVGFAIPANTVRRVVPELIENQKVDYPWIGISAPPESSNLSVAALADPLDLPVNAGVLVTAINEDSPADKAGLLPGSRLVQIRGSSLCIGGDIIVAVDNNYVRGIDELLAYLVMNSSPGDVVNLLVVRGNDTFEIPLTLESRPTGAIGVAKDNCS